MSSSERAAPPPIPDSALQRAYRPEGMPFGAARPMTEDEYQHAMNADITLWARTGEKYYHPHRCRWERTSGHDPSLRPRKFCEVMVEDPRIVRYCAKHALAIGYPLTPEQQSAMLEFEARHALRELAPEAVQTVRDIMRDPDAPPGIRQKAAADILDRNSINGKIQVEAKVETTIVDITSIIRERLEAKRARLLGNSDSPVIDGEVVEMRPQPVEPPPPTGAGE